MPIEGVYKPGSNPQESFGICIYGQGGTGKTTLAGTMPGKGLVIDIPWFEGGTFVLTDKADRIDIKTCTEWSQLDAIYRALSDKAKHDYKWVAIDSVTAMQEMAKRKTIGERDISTDPHKTSLAEYGKIGSLVGELVHRFRMLPLHTLWIAQERSDHDGAEGRTVVGPDLLPGAFKTLSPSMAMMGRLSVEQNADASGWERHFRIGPSEAYRTKYRALPGVDVPAVIVNPNLTQIMRWNFGVPNTERPQEAVASTAFIVG